jgi:hypothetical protein
VSWSLEVKSFLFEALSHHPTLQLNKLTPFSSLHKTPKRLHSLLKSKKIHFILNCLQLHVTKISIFFNLKSIFIVQHKFFFQPTAELKFLLNIKNLFPLNLISNPLKLICICRYREKNILMLLIFFLPPLSLLYTRRHITLRIFITQSTIKW